jgi:hypothetical protein
MEHVMVSIGLAFIAFALVAPPYIAGRTGGVGSALLNLLMVGIAAFAFFSATFLLTLGIWLIAVVHAVTVRRSAIRHRELIEAIRPPPKAMKDVNAAEFVRRARGG